MHEKNLLQVTPYLLTPDVAAMVRFFVKVLGFHAWVQDDFYAYCSRDEVAVRIGKLSEPTGEGVEERVEIGARAWLFYIDVMDVAAVVEEIRPKLLAAGMQSGVGPVDQSWEKREYWAPVPGGGFVIYGQDIARMPMNPPMVEA